eukprot:478096-Alexandrium_andersonii.AAC.1
MATMPQGCTRRPAAAASACGAGGALPGCCPWTRPLPAGRPAARTSHAQAGLRATTTPPADRPRRGAGPSALPPGGPGQHLATSRRRICG